MSLLALLAVAQGTWCAERGEPVRQSAIPSQPVHRDVDDDFAEGAGLSILHTRDSDRLRTTRLFAGALVDYRTAYDFTAVGASGTRYDQDSWSAERYSLRGAVRKVERATGAGVFANAGVSTVGDHQKLIGEGSWNIRASPSAGFEFIGQRDFVETHPGIEFGMMSNFVAASADVAVTERLTLIGLAGGQWYSDDNRRTHLRGHAVFLLLPEQGLSAVVRIRTYESSRPGNRFYFNPEDYQRADLGLRLRRSFAHWRLSAAGGGGKERIDHNDEQPTHYLELRAERSFANNLALAMAYSLSHARESDTASASAYTWRYFRAVVTLPF